jgi:hypothetical protein
VIGISIDKRLRIGDVIQFSSLPENYFRHRGEKLIDVDKCWVFDFNPYVVRDETPTKIVELWNFPKKYEWPRPRELNVYQSNAEIWASLLGVPVILNRPRLYRFEGFPYERREHILFHTKGICHGELPKHVIDHIKLKYGQRLRHIGLPTENNHGITRLPTPSFWDLAREISRCRMLICPDSGPGWVGACYPDVIVKKIRVKELPNFPKMKEWVPLDRDNYHTHWDDRNFQVYNITEDDAGYTYSYKKL